MSWRKIFRRTAILLTFMSFFALSEAHAEIKIYEGVGEYLMTDETVNFAKEQAETLAQRDILEKICVYVEEESIMIDNELDKDEIITISAGILYVIDTKFSMAEDDAGIIVKSFVTAQIDTDELKILLDKAVKERISDD